MNISIGDSERSKSRGEDHESSYLTIAMDIPNHHSKRSKSRGRRDDLGGSRDDRQKKESRRLEWACPAAWSANLAFVCARRCMHLIPTGIMAKQRNFEK